MKDPRDRKVTRRDILRAGSCGAVLASVSGMTSVTSGPATQTQPAAGKAPLPKGVLGRTKYPVTLLSCGGIRLSDRLGTRVLKYAVDQGVNLVHTAESYGGGASIRAVAGLFKADKRYRDKVFLCLKGRKHGKKDELEGMLKTLGVDHADVLLTTLHKPDVGQLEKIQARQDRYKKEGKLRHTGFVCHVDMNGSMELVLEKAPDYFDMAMLAMTMIPAPGNPEYKEATDESKRFLKNVKALRSKGVGLLSMKSGAQKSLKKGAAYFQAHAKAVLQVGVDSILTSFSTFEQVDMIKQLDLRSPHLTPAEQKAAAEIRRERAGACLMCGQCNKACPKQLPVSDVMRCRMYHDEYGWYEHARAELADLGVDWARTASGCANCSACAGVCPVGLAGPKTIADITSRLA